MTKQQNWQEPFEFFISSKHDKTVSRYVTGLPLIMLSRRLEVVALDISNRGWKHLYRLI
jgi:hypothetical protein